MQAAGRDKDAEIDVNLASFLQMLPDLLPEHRGACALMRGGEIVAFHASPLEAQMAGNNLFDDGLFSIQEVQDHAEELGCFAYALSSRSS